MAFRNRRDRVVVFRLSSEEYDSLKSACSAAGARNVSDYTRSGLLALIQSQSVESAIRERCVALDHAIADLRKSVVELSERIDSVGGPGLRDA